jgi:hypothetical protein
MRIDIDLFNSADDFSERGQEALLKEWRDYYDRLPDSRAKKRLYASVCATGFRCLVLGCDHEEWKDRLTKLLLRQSTFVPHWQSSPFLRQMAEQQRRVEL